MEYLYGLSIRDNIKEIMNMIDSDTISNYNDSTLVYYAIKLIAEIDRLERSMLNSPTVDQVRVRGLTDSIRASLDKLNSKIHHTDYFNGLTDNHTCIRMLSNYRNSGTSLNDAVNEVARQLGTTKGAVTDFIKDAKYPVFTPGSKEFSLGSDLASKDYGPSSESMYKHIDEYELSPDKVNDFIAGYLSVKPLTEDESNLEMIKSKLHQFSYTPEAADELITEYNKYLRR